MSNQIQKIERRGLALALALILIPIILIIAFGLTQMGTQNLSHADAARHSKKALFAAETGAMEAMRQLDADSTWSAGWNQPQTLPGTKPTYTVEVVNNSAGTSTLTASNGAAVAPGMTYVLSTGSSRDGDFTRRVGVMLRVSKGGGSFPYAIASGSNITLKAGTDIEGSIKASGDVVFEANTDIVAVDGKGWVLAGANIDNKNNVKFEDDQQLAAAGNNISNQGGIKNTPHVYSNPGPGVTFQGQSVQQLIAPFIADGRITNDPPPGQEVMPNPDMTKLLAPGTYVDHGSTTDINKTFDLDGKTHLFSKGVTFKGKITGRGTIVVTNGNSVVFEGPIGQGNAYQEMNVIATDGHNGTVGGNSIIFKRAAKIRGLIYSHDDVTSEASLSVYGSIISYKKDGGDVVHSGASLDVFLRPPTIPVLGFEAFFSSGGGSGSSGMSVISWQRL
jgi:Tfp pilus assembly protein PilV